jgi:hypothetical protein
MYRYVRIGMYVCLVRSVCPPIFPYHMMRILQHVGHSILFQHVESTDVKYTSELKYFLRTIRYTAIIIDL